MYTKIEKIYNLAEMPAFDRPREKIKKKGVIALSDSELLAVFLNSDTSRMNVLKLAESVSDAIDQYHSKDLFEKLMGIHGIGEARALSICAVMEFVRRKILPASQKIRTPADVYSWLKPYCDKKQEHFIVFSINGGNEIISRRVVTVGLLNSSQIHPREVFADAIAERAASIILAHNHPSGNCEPSAEDISITEKLQTSGDILGIPVLDHLVFSETGFTSFMERELL